MNNNNKENLNFQNFINFTYSFNSFQYTKEQALIDLQEMLSNNELKDFNFINYEKLFYIDVYYNDDDNIQFYLKQIKTLIANNWHERQLILNRIN